MLPQVIGENEWLIALDKPAGLIVHSDGRTQEPSLADWVGQTYPNLKGVGGVWVSPQGENIPLNGLAHRLDRTTSGVVLVAKTQESFEYLKQEFKARNIRKKYLAWVYGKMPALEGTIVAEIMRSSDLPKRWYARTCQMSDVRAAITEWKVVESKVDASLLELAPKTGRTHQIRVHLAHIGHSIIADHLYAPNRESMLGFKRTALHALAIALILPDGSSVEYVAPEPEDFLAARLTR
jgi:23S rRNA pseudouridine1911/1915/1917 synthase